MRLLPFALVLSSCGPSDAAASPAVPAPFIAFARDFESYASWTTFDRGEDTVPPTHAGQTWIHVDPVPAPHSTTVPVGTRIVRVEQRGDDPTEWELHAMVKRGGDYNRDGAVGWEFFELALDDQRRPSVVWRGEGPPNGDGYQPVEGGELFGCNHCHASDAAVDSVLSPALQLSAPSP